MTDRTPLISIIIPIYNGVRWINRCFRSILNQTAINILDLEVCICNDASTDETIILLEEWQETFNNMDIPLKIFKNRSDTPGGVGYSKNRAVSISTGNFLCFQDIDDVMLPNRIIKQYEKTSNETEYTLIFERKKVGGFFESKRGTPEDLVFFNKHLDLGGKICRVDECLLIYTFHSNQATLSIHEDTIWNLRLERLEKVVLNNWSKFTIWNAGKQGRKLYNSLSQENKSKVEALCDVDKNKIGHKYTPFDPVERKSGPEIDIIHFKDAIPPFVICMKIL
ncbi:hypothetical protein NQ314_019626 [Rhamnusium bicolor]|uniref:Glycosyltransferase 2-like domain-containing protein n=1 Tax=Rhamnusium bicolor TaxID=1586634 RepID=A0AAV8WNY5_9CUCU|nr:hypothetical protein NQ314_019626 [Rhamnusium bicolor]